MDEVRDLAITHACKNTHTHTLAHTPFLSVCFFRQGVLTAAELEGEFGETPDFLMATLRDLEAKKEVRKSAVLH